MPSAGRRLPVGVGNDGEGEIAEQVGNDGKRVTNQSFDFLVTTFFL